MTPSLTAESLLFPLDDLRRRILRALGPRVGTWARHREMRVGVMGIGVVAFALCGTLLAPLWMLAIGPILFGVPHLLADVRYLWVRPAFHRRRLLWIGAGVPILLAAVTSHPAWGFVAMAGALTVANTTHLKRAFGIACALGLLAVSVRLRTEMTLALAHLHNFVAIALWWAWRKRDARWHHAVLLAFAMCTLMIGVGAFDGHFGSLDRIVGLPSHISMRGHVAWLAPFADARIGTRLVLLFAFAQSVHYGIWLRLVPEEDRERPAPRTFIGTYRALVCDLGKAPLAIVTFCAIGLALWAFFDLAAARASYLRFALFHGHLEFAAAALLWAERPVSRQGECAGA